MIINDEHDLQIIEIKLNHINHSSKNRWQQTIWRALSCLPYFLNCDFYDY